MNPELHKMWNEERQPDRGSSREGEQVLPKEVSKNKLSLKQHKPR